MKGSPWEPIPLEQDAVPEASAVRDDAGLPFVTPEVAATLPPRVEVSEPHGPRRVYLRADHEISQYAAVHGYTPNCPGCLAIQTGGRPRNHTELCRRNVVNFMMQSQTGK